ncbi:hypothetical protein NQ315_001563 [Exocentrus adspersus]|uniref:Sulfotransferase domain-containing protein n=1 Tax=Exocentrus adspersus TaxID=1586481 RepID=A0AAV8WAC6_9CUCU|nr:hypothetical protein NQ315_001563 [Exocentrus adspersus]
MTECPMPRRRTIFKELPFDVVENPHAHRLTMPDLEAVFVGPKRYVQSDRYKEFGLDIYNFEARPDDVYLIGYLRSGTTLTCEIVWQIGNDLDYEGAAKDFMDYRFPHIDVMGTLEVTRHIPKTKTLTEEMKEIIHKYQQLDLKGLSEREGRRFIKSHLALSLMPPHIFEVGAKVIYCARHPRDVIVSLYEVSSFFRPNGPQAEFKDMLEDFINDAGWNCPYFEHVKEAWERRNDANFLFLFYEDTIKDKRQTIRKVAQFLGKSLSENQVDSLEDYLSLEKFKNNKSVNCDQLVKLGVAKDTNRFIRKGKSEGWRQYFDAEMKEKFDKWMEKNLQDTDLRFPEK